MQGQLVTREQREALLQSKRHRLVELGQASPVLDQQQLNDRFSAAARDLKAVLSGPSHLCAQAAQAVRKLSCLGGFDSSAGCSSTAMVCCHRLCSKMIICICLLTFALACTDLINIKATIFRDELVPQLIRVLELRCAAFNRMQITP